MKIDLPEDLERSIRAEVHSGHFASADELVAQAVRLLLRKQGQPQPLATPPIESGDSAPDPILGLMCDDTELMDEIVANAYTELAGLNADQNIFAQSRIRIRRYSTSRLSAKGNPK